MRGRPHPLAPRATDDGAAPFHFDTLSPDGAVLAAQAKASFGVAEANAARAAAAAAANGVAAMRLGEAAPTSAAAAAPAAPTAAAAPPLFELAPALRALCDAAAAAAAGAAAGGRAALHLVVLGHVDAGKSTLMGRLLFELGLLDEKTVHRTRRDAAAAGKAASEWAWMLDERPEERARGVTVDVATSRFDTPRRRVTLLDAPGHRDFVPAAIAGAAAADAALLVVDGSPGGFEAGFAAAAPDAPAGGGQTREHAALARALGVAQAAVVVTKLDTCGFAEARFLEVRAALEPYLLRCGFAPGRVAWLPVVGPTGENMVTRPADARLAAWYAGPTLVEAIDAFAPRPRDVERPARLAVAEVRAAPGRGGKAGGEVVVAGKVEAGALAPGSRVRLSPSGALATVRSIAVGGAPAPVARAGDAAEATLAGLDPGAVAPGDVVCDAEHAVPAAQRFTARLVVLDVPVPILRGAQVTLHAHALRGAATVTALLSLLDPRTGAETRARPRCLLPGQSALVEVTPEAPVALEPAAACRALGRIALRDGGRTIAVGVVTTVVAAPPKGS